MSAKTPKITKVYRFHLYVSPGGGIQKEYHVETSATTRKEARDKVFWLVASGPVRKITFCGIVTTEDQ